MKMFLRKFKGGHVRPPNPHWRQVLNSGVFAFIAIALLAWLGEVDIHPWVLGSFGASCVLLFGYPESPFSQPRNIIFGHTLSTLIGLVFLSSVGVHWWSMGLAVAFAIVLMMSIGVMHPPAGSNPLIVLMIQPNWKFLLTPTLAGALILVLLGLFLINLQTDKHYPKYW